MRKRDIFVIFIFFILGIIYRKPGVPKALKLYVEYVREKQDRKEPIVLNYKIDFSRWKLSLYSDNEELLYENDYFQKAYFPYPEVKEIKYTITENENEITIVFEFYKEDLILYVKGLKKYEKNSKFDIIKEISNSNSPNVLPFQMEVNIHKKAGELNEFILNQPKTINGLKLNEISMSEYDVEGNIIKTLNFKNEEIIVEYFYLANRMIVAVNTNKNGYTINYYNWDRELIAKAIFKDERTIEIYDLNNKLIMTEVVTDDGEILIYNENNKLVERVPLKNKNSNTSSKKYNQFRKIIKFL
ncbi:hypothetical protein FNSP10_22080 [Fusobacterium nucleatum]|nr:hypothetical protein FNCP10_02210 [Fusobacterium nucleatum]BEP08834.1 hypothetical protein FNSP10_22080 [Fusobacterium nucleatum]